jgi:hypothetical protein
VPAAQQSIHLILDNQRHWRVGGAFLEPDPGASKDQEEPGHLHKKLNEAYRQVFKAAGFDAWIDLQARAGHAGGL